MFQNKKQAKAADKKSEDELDPERVLKLKECCDMLLAGGYFRARISALTPFDRVVGGLVWSITASNVDVDVDIIFQENSTIGQRIKLSDSIVRALVRMKCPFRIDPHEIQGLQYDKLFSVIQWLVRKVIETRQLTGDTVRALSESQFSKHYELPEEHRPEPAREFVGEICEQYRPRRKFKKRQGTVFKSDVAKAEATLLEYGEKFYTAEPEEEEDEAKAAPSAQFSQKRAGLMAKFGEKGQPSAEEKKKKEEEERKKREVEEAQRLAGIQAGLEDTGADGDISVNQFIDVDQIGQFDEALRRQEAESKEEIPSGVKGLQQAFKRQVDALRRQIGQQESAVTAARQEKENQSSKTETLKSELEKKTAYNERCVVETQKLEEVEASHPKKALLQQLKDMVMLNENLKRQESQFKANCKAQLAQLQQMIASLDSEDGDEETKRMVEIEKIYDNDLGKLNKLRMVLAAKNQEIARIQRLIDEIPTRAELIQYERRFVELYELVAEKLVETRKYYAMYNTLEETHRYMTSEVSLLESINQNFPKHIKTKAGTDAFINSFKEIVDGVDRSIQQVAQEKDREVADRDKLAEQHKKLLEKQRKYFKAVKEFQEECYKNEKLSEALAQYTSTAQAETAAAE